MDGAGEVAVKVVQFGVHTKRQLAAFVNEVAVLHDTRHPHIVLMLGAYLGRQHMYMVQELLHSDLYCALGCKEQQAALRWGARCASRAGRALHVGTCCASVILHGHLHASILCMPQVTAADSWRAVSTVQAVGLARPIFPAASAQCRLAGHSCHKLPASGHPACEVHTGAFSRGNGLGVALDIATGLHCFHCNGVVHCDIK